MIANIVTISRILFSICLFVISPSSALFVLLYVLCGMTDVLDGFLARMLHTESKVGERLDSIADLFFAVVYAGKILPIMCLPTWIWIWIILIAIAKIMGIIKRSKEEQKVYIKHSIANKLTGMLIFLLPLTVRLIEVKYGAVVVCVVATLAAMQELLSRNDNE